MYDKKLIRTHENTHQDDEVQENKLSYNKETQIIGTMPFNKNVFPHIAAAQATGVKST